MNKKVKRIDALKFGDRVKIDGVPLLVVAPVIGGGLSLFNETTKEALFLRVKNPFDVVEVM